MEWKEDAPLYADDSKSDRRVFDMDECQCGCHCNAEIHIVACCIFCKLCRKNITSGKYPAHVVTCNKQLNISSLVIQRDAKYRELIAKANNVVGRYGYAVTLSEALVLKDDVLQSGDIVLTVDTNGTFPGIRVLSKLCDELTEAIGASVAQISFCLFSRSQEPKTE